MRIPEAFYPCPQRLVLLAALVAAAAAPGCARPTPQPATPPAIVDRPIPFSQQRVGMTRSYIREHYGLEVPDIRIEPRIVVLHWTAIPTLEGSYNAFRGETLPGARADLAGAGQVNVSTQFLVDRDGTIYRLMPEDWMARHVIGLNYNAIGVENVGGTGGKEDLTEAQVAANIHLVRYLSRKYPGIQYLIGHSEYREFEGHPLWRERDAGYRTAKTDPGPRFMGAVRAGVQGLGLKGPEDVRRETRAAALKPRVISHAGWEASPPVGEQADADRRNLAVGGVLRFRDLAVTLRAMEAGADSAAPRDAAVLELSAGGEREVRRVVEGDAFNWGGYHLALLAAHPRPGELGAGLAELEVARVGSLPPALAAASTAGGAASRLRVPQQIRAVTLHHSGSAKPVLPGDDVVGHLRGLQSWGERDKNWWDVPYHFLIGPEGEIYEGRDYRFMGETNTAYDPRGNLLISVLGNYNKQEATPAQLEAITQLMTWAVARFEVPLDSIRGHADLADTDCPGSNLRRYLTDGSFREGVRARLQRAGLR